MERLAASVPAIWTHAPQGVDNDEAPLGAPSPRPFEGGDNETATGRRTEPRSDAARLFDNPIRQAAAAAAAVRARVSLRAARRYIFSTPASLTIFSQRPYSPFT
jgi:hypothetical protein